MTEPKPILRYAEAMPVLGVAKAALRKSVCLNYRASRGQRQRLRKVSVMKLHFNDRTEANLGLCRGAADNLEQREQ